jgi:hypothetical protein
MSVVGPAQMAIEKYKLNVRRLAIVYHGMQCRSIKSSIQTGVRN